MKKNYCLKAKDCKDMDTEEYITTPINHLRFYYFFHSFEINFYYDKEIDERRFLDDWDDIFKLLVEYKATTEDGPIQGYRNYTTERGKSYYFSIKFNHNTSKRYSKLSQYIKLICSIFEYFQNKCPENLYSILKIALGFYDAVQYPNFLFSYLFDKYPNLEKMLIPRIFALLPPEERLFLETRNL